MRGMDDLRSSAMERAIERSPSVPRSAFPRPKYSDKTSNGLTKCIVDFLRIKGWQAERISVEGRVLDNRKTYTDIIGRSKTIGSVRRIKSSSQLGSADISATIYGKSVKIEVKIGRDTQSDKQKEYQDQIVRSGGIYLIARDFQGFFNWYQDFWKGGANG